MAYGWTPRAHAPAILKLPDIDLVAVCTAHKETAIESAKKYGAPMAFHNHNEMLEKAELDAVAIVVRVPLHYQFTVDAIKAGKHVYTEWPLGVNLKEAQGMADLVRKEGSLSMVGLQSRVSPVLMRTKDLIRDGYVGQVLSAHLEQFNSGVLSRTSSRTWQKDKSLGATTLSIAFGHSVDALCMCLGEFGSISATVRTQVPEWRETDTGRIVDVDAPDNILVNGVLKNGAAISIHVGSIPYNGSGYRFEIYGSEGTLVVKSSGTPAIDEARLYGFRGESPRLTRMRIPKRYTWIPDDVPTGAPFNIAQLWYGFCQAIYRGRGMEPNFGLAVRRHELLDAVQTASDTGQTQYL